MNAIKRCSKCGRKIKKDFCSHCSDITRTRKINIINALYKFKISLFIIYNFIYYYVISVVNLAKINIASNINIILSFMKYNINRIIITLVLIFTISGVICISISLYINEVIIKTILIIITFIFIFIAGVCFQYIIEK